METLIAYFAGAIDADGYFSIQKTQRTKGERHSHRPIYYEARVGFTGTLGDEVQQLLKETFGGGVYYHQPKNPRYKKWAAWQVTGKNAGAAAEVLIPHLRMKRRQAELIVEFVAVLARQKAEMQASQKPPYRITEAMANEREQYWLNISQLNAPRNRRVYMVADELEGHPE